MDNAHCYVLETRAQDPPHSFGEEAIPKSGLVLYSIDTRGVSTCGDMTIVPGPDSNGNSQETINVAAMLTPGFPCLPFKEHQNVPLLPRTCLTDWGNHIRFTAVDEAATSSTYRVRVQVETATNPLDEQVKGIVMRGGQAFLRVLSHLPGVPLPPAENPLPIPDNDLHLYTDDGRHVGINYASGEFENQIADADLSGNQLNGQEWIVVPASTPGLHFIVSNLPTVQFLHMFPQLQSDLGATDAIEIKGVAASPYSAPYDSNPITVDVLIGGFVEVPMEATQNPDGSLTVTLGEAVVTIDSLIAELDSYYAAGAIKTTDAYNGLRDKLVAAKHKILKGKNRAAINQLRAFQNQLGADNLVDLFARQTMEQDSQTLINSLSGQ